MWGHRVAVPESLRMLLLEQIHNPHLGNVKTKSITRSYIWGPQIDRY